MTNEPVIGFEVPDAAIPVRLVVLVLVQLNVVPETLLGLVIVILLIGSPEQCVCELGVAFTVGPGLIITVTVKFEEGQPFAVAVIVNVVVCCVLVLLVNVPVMGFDVPEVAIPVKLVVLVLVQLKVVPDTLLGFVITILVIGFAEHNV